MIARTSLLLKPLKTFLYIRTAMTTDVSVFFKRETTCTSAHDVAQALRHDRQHRPFTLMTKVSRSVFTANPCLPHGLPDGTLTPARSKFRGTSNADRILANQHARSASTSDADEETATPHHDGERTRATHRPCGASDRTGVALCLYSCALA